MKLRQQLQIIGKNIKSSRADRGFSQSDLGALINTDKQNISKIENGNTNITISTLVKIANALEVNSSDLLCSDKPLEKQK